MFEPRPSHGSGHGGDSESLPCRRLPPARQTPRWPTSLIAPHFPPQVATERLDAHKIRRDGMALVRPSSLRVSSSQPELRRRKVASEHGVTAAVPPLPAAGSTLVTAVVNQAVHAAHTARTSPHRSRASPVAVRRRAWGSASGAGHSRIPPSPSTLAPPPPSNRVPGPVLAVSPSAPCLSRRGELPPLIWRPDRLRSPWQGARYGEPLTNEQAPRAAPTALHGMPEFTPRIFPSLSCPYSATRCKIGSGKDRAIAARLDQVGQYLPHS